jgi:hypothetical protein
MERLTKKFQVAWANAESSTNTVARVVMGDIIS